ncbi:MAG: RsmB/NOP family class I SAM-dependent RNA methyltransferase [Rhodospirillaceae bacterium]|nr:RsmB/NOP family class I SAM-dependent RNA methyltransferase [Rhodospirillaceae bacterium]
MTPGARIQAAIDLLDRIEAPPPGEAALPADAVLNAYFRSRRYIGAKDRRAVGDLVHRVLRERARIDWRLALPGDAARGNRLRALYAAAEIQPDLSSAALAGLCDGAAHRPAPLSAAERAALDAGLQAAPPRPPEPWQAYSFPAWLAPELERGFGPALAEEMAALLQPAPTDLRVNSLKASRAAVQAALAAAGIAAAPTPFAPLGLRLEGRANLAGLEAFRQGWFEIQDEASQLVAVLADARPGQRILDLCAGAGGKTLALAAAMQNRGHILAGDTDATRLARLAPRLARSGATIVETRVLGGGDDAVPGPFHRVLVDAPCSGSGTWRRHPDAKWRLTADRLDAYRALQAKLLAAGAAATARGGRLVYVTCSILPSEGRTRIEAFLAETGNAFRPLDAAAAWPDLVGGAAPFDGPFMLLTPRRHGTDGFFAAILERAA